ncbi:MAG: hypothetical protein NTZ27_09885 [Ignavibacteriales bacterium]|nr:hypothetical protein [Ignavibacteriales bacterium]
MQHRFRNIFFFFFIALCSISLFSCAHKDNNTDEIANPDPNTPEEADPTIIPKFVINDYIELSKISQISKFRSSAGHDYSDEIEHCRSMKHYYRPSDYIDASTIKIYSPINGTVDRTIEEWAGTQVQIRSDQYPNYYFIIFHINLSSPLKVGDKVIAGKQIGTHIGSQTSSDIAVVHMIPNHPYNSIRKLISYFDVITDTLFQNYQQHGITSRNDIIISKEARDANPLNCNGEYFTTSETIEDWVVLK